MAMNTVTARIPHELSVPLRLGRLHDQADRRRSQPEPPRHHGLPDALVEDSPGDQGVPLGDPAPTRWHPTLQPAHRTRHHAVAAPGPAADLGEPEALPVEPTNPFALGLGDVQGVDGATHGDDRCAGRIEGSDLAGVERAPDTGHEL